MSRQQISPDRRVATEPRDGISAAEPVAGLYRMRLKSGAVYSAIRLWYGQPLDPVTGEEMDRSLRWCATANGRIVSFDWVWPSCTAEPIDQAEYDHILRTFEWGQKNAPNSPQANPHKKADLLTAPLPF